MLDVETNEEALHQSHENAPLKKFRSLHDVYERCNIVYVEPAVFEEAEKHEVWRKTMEKEIKVIEKNQT